MCESQLPSEANVAWLTLDSVIHAKAWLLSVSFQHPLGCGKNLGLRLQDLSLLLCDPGLLSAL